MNTFAKGSAPILKARFRPTVAAIAITLDTDEEQTMFVSPAALEEAIGVELKVADIRMLAGGVVTYQHSHVVQGEEFTWTKQDNAEVFVCNRPQGLDIFNIVAINFPNDSARDIYFQENCVAKTTEDDYALAKVVRAEKRAARSLNTPKADQILVELKDTIEACTTLAELKTLAGEYDEFAGVLDSVLAATKVKAAKAIMVGALNLPF